MADDDELHEQIIPNTNRRLQVTKTRRKLFGKARQEKFLDHLAATCNVTASAAAAGVCVGTVYAERRRNAAFREAWRVALEQGYARLEAALLERAERGLDRPRIGAGEAEGGPSTGSGQAMDVPAEADWNRGMDLLRQHQRALAGVPHRGGHAIRRVGTEALRERIVRKLKAIGYRIEEEPAEAAPPPASAEGSGRSPSPAKAGED
jgi:hypothetical protein